MKRKPLTVLIVCKGNAGRSAAVEHFLRKGIEEAGLENIEVFSRGTGVKLKDVKGVPSSLLRLMDSLGCADYPHHKPTQVKEEDLRKASFVLAINPQIKEKLLSDFGHLEGISNKLIEFKKFSLAGLPKTERPPESLWALEDPLQKFDSGNIKEGIAAYYSLHRLALRALERLKNI